MSKNGSLERGGSRPGPRDGGAERGSRDSRAARMSPLAGARLVVVATGALAVGRPLRLVELERLELDLLAEQLLDVGDQARVVARDQRDRQPRGAGARGAADAVDVVLGVVRHVEVEDRRQVDDVEAARGDVGRDQDVDLALLERLERLQPLVLRLVAVQRVGAQAVALERARQAGAAELGVDEDERLRDRALLQQLQHGAPLVVGRDAVEVLLDVARGRVRPRHLDQDRVLQVALGQPPDLGREGRREEQRLALLGQVREDALQVGQEADVEHPVGLVEDDVLDLVQDAVLRLDVVEQAPRRRDEHLDALLQLERLRLHVDAAEDDRDAQLRVRRVALDVVGDLVGELARRRDHEGAHRVARRRHAGVLVRQHLVQQRQRERRRLAGAGLRRAHDVAPGEDDRDRLRLDRRHRRVALVGDGALQDRREADRGELEGGSVGVGAGRRGRGRLARKRVQRAVGFIHDAIIAPRPGERRMGPWPAPCASWESAG